MTQNGFIISPPIFDQLEQFEFDKEVYQLVELGIFEIALVNMAPVCWDDIKP
jgi:hypothetical protein